MLGNAEDVGHAPRQVDQAVDRRDVALAALWPKIGEQLHAADELLGRIPRPSLLASD